MSVGTGASKLELSVREWLTYLAAQDAKATELFGLLMAGRDSGNLGRPLLVDTSGRPIIVGPAADNAAAVGSPLRAGGVYRATQPTYADLDIADLGMSPSGDLVVAPRAKKITLQASAVKTASFTADPVTGLEFYRHAFIMLHVTAQSGTTPTLDVRVWAGPAAAGDRTGMMGRFAEVGAATGEWVMVVGVNGSIAPVDAGALLTAGTVRGITADYTSATGKLQAPVHWGDRMSIDVVIGGATPSYTFQVTAWMIP